MTFATFEDVAETLGRPISDQAEIDQVSAWLRRVESRIRSRVPGLDVLVAADPEYHRAVADVEADVVARRVLNPEGKQNERIDDYSYGRSEEFASASLWPTAEEWLLLVPGTGRAAFSTRPSFEPDRERVPWRWL